MVKQRTVYMKVTNDRYELPMAIADSAKELSKLVGAPDSSIRTCAYRYSCGKVKHSIYRMVEIEDE